MDLLRNLGSAAATSLLQKSGISLPYSLGEKVHEYDGKSIWTLYNATKKDDSSPVSVFHFDASGSRRSSLPFARNALKKLRTTRHPDILKFIDVVEQGESIWIMTERVRPLRPVLFSWTSSTGSAKAKDKEREEWTIWGLHRIAVALAFINSTCASTHGNISIDSIFLSPSGEWRLGGLELLSSTKDENPVLFTLGSQFPRNQDTSSPEVKKNGWNAIKELDPGISDAYALGLLLNTVFNQTDELPATAHPPHPAPTGASRGRIPPGVFPLYKKLLNPGTKQRLAVQSFLEIGVGEKAGLDGAPGRFFTDNHLVSVCSRLEGYPLASDGEKAEFIKDLRDSAGSFPPEFAINKLIPAMFSGLAHGGANSEMVISLVLDFGKLADPNEVDSATTSQRTYKLDHNQYSQVILTPLVKLFSSTDRATRMALLKNMPRFAARLEAKVVQDGVWPHLQTGLSDTVAAIREATLIAINEIPNKLSNRVLNNDLLRHLARLQSDPEPSIRTNTCIMIAKLAPLLSESTQKKVLVPAFSKGLKDPFIHARIAALQGFTSCVDCFDMEEAATKVIGVIAVGLVDKEKVVRDPAFKCFDTYRQRIEKYAASLPETAILPGGAPPGALPTTGLSSGDILSTATGMAGGVAGWAFESLSSRLAPKDLNSKMAAPPSASPAQSSSPAPPVAPTSSASTSTKSTSGHAPTRTTNKAKGMALGSKLGTKGGLANGHAALMAELEKEMNEDASDLADAWDNAEDQPQSSGDLMDVHADQDDWSAFETAPTPTVAVSSSSVAVPVSANPWQDSAEDVSSAFSQPPSYPTLSTQSGLQAKPVTSPIVTSGRSTPSAVMSTLPSTWQSPVTSPKPTAVKDEWGGFGDDMIPVAAQAQATATSASGKASPTANLSGMSKEEKAAEMTRRREERKARIAQLKEQKKGAA